MKKYSRSLSYVASALFLTASFASANAVAGVKNLQLTVTLDDTTEHLMFDNTGRCAPVGVIGVVGVTTGTGEMTIATNSGKKTVSTRVSIVATDCPDANHNFSNGKFELISVGNANDRLTATYHGSFVAGNAGELKMNGGAFAITGGTGIFDGSSGTGQLQGVVYANGVDIITAIQNNVPIKGNLQAAGKISFSKDQFQQKYDFFGSE